jgi:RNA polymerase sigma-70 factor (sigma-E family)
MGVGADGSEGPADPDDDFRQFVEARWTALVRFGYLLTGDWAAAEDLVQVALERSWRRWGQVRDGRPWAPEAYVKAAMANQLRSWWRARRVTAVSLAHVTEPPEPGSDPGPGHALRDSLWRELLLLPPRMRAVVVLRVWEDLSEIETARVMGCSPGSVKSQMSRAMARLRRQPGVLEAAGRNATEVRR